MSLKWVILVLGILISSVGSFQDDTPISFSNNPKSSEKGIPPELIPLAEFFQNFHGFDTDSLARELEGLEISEPCRSDVNYTLPNYFSSMWGLKSKLTPF